MWHYKNVYFIYDNPVDSVFSQPYTFPLITTYVKSKFALMQALRMYVDNSYLGPYAEIHPRSVKHDPPIKI